MGAQVNNPEPSAHGSYPSVTGSEPVKEQELADGGSHVLTVGAEVIDGVKVIRKKA